MSMNFMDRFTSQDEKIEAVGNQLAEQTQILQSILQSEGVAESPDATQYRPTPFENAVIPGESGRLAIPAGRTRFDFENGVIRHETVGELDAELRSFDDMSTAVEGAKIQSLRSLYAYADAQVQLELDDGDSGRFTIDPSLYFPIQSQGFRQFTVYAGRPVEIYAVASTRARAFTSDAVQNHSDRVGSLSGVYDTYQDVGVHPQALSDFLPEGENAASYADAEIDARAHNRHTFTVENNSGNGSGPSIDARLVAADTDSMTFRTIGAEKTGVADGNHFKFDIQERHKYYKLQVRNSTDGSDITVDAAFFGGS